MTRVVLSVLTAIFKVNLGLLKSEAKDDDGGGGDNWTTGAISRAKLWSNHHHQQTNIQHFYRPDALPVSQLLVILGRVAMPLISPLDASTPND